MSDAVRIENDDVSETMAKRDDAGFMNDLRATLFDVVP